MEFVHIVLHHGLFVFGFPFLVGAFKVTSDGTMLDRRSLYFGVVNVLAEMFLYAILKSFHLAA